MKDGRVAAFTLGSYALLSALPLVLAARATVPANALALIGVEVACWAVAWAALGRLRRLHWLVLPAFLLAPVDWYLYRHYGHGLSSRHIAIIAESDVRETMELLRGSVLMLAGAIGVCATWWVWLLRAGRGTATLDWHAWPRAIVVLGAAASVASVVTGGTARRLAAGLEARVDVADTRPFGLYAGLAGYWADHRDLEVLERAKRPFLFGARREGAAGEPLVVVLVIGESSRADRWSLDGYARRTNPRLAREPGVVFFPDTVAAASATLLSVPVLLTRRRAADSYRSGFAERSLVSAFHEAGYRTWWLSNQIPFGEFDTPVSVFAHEADVVSFYNPGSYSGRSTPDGVLLAPLARALVAPAAARLVVLHTLGSHWNYAQRYPAGFGRWQPALSGDAADPDAGDPSVRLRIGNSYDNSVLYTDWFLDAVIAQLRARGGRAAMFYVSDHGEDLRDGQCPFSLHGHNTRFDYHVPMLAWTSDAFASAWPGKVAQLRAHAGAPASLENVFETVLGLGDIGYPGGRPGWNLLSQRFAPHVRLVDSYGWADYDHSRFQGDCQEVIGRDPPLPRSADPL